jgi:outer membrane protein
MLKKLLLIALLAVPGCLLAQNEVPVQTVVAARPHFGTISYNELLKAMPEYAYAQENINLLQGKYEAEIKRSEEEFNQKYSEFIKDQKNFPETILLRRQKELQQLMEQSIEFRNQVKDLLEKAKKEMVTPLNQKLNNVIAEVAAQYQLEYVLNTDNNCYPYINTAYGMDLTQLVKAKLGI